MFDWLKFRHDFFRTRRTRRPPRRRFRRVAVEALEDRRMLALVGDMDFDDDVDFDDIDDFVLGLTNATAYESLYGVGPDVRGDTDGDADQDFDDIALFVELLPALPVTIASGLANDTATGGTTNTDLITMDPVIAGGIVEGLANVGRLEARVDLGPIQMVSLMPGGLFQFDPGLALNGSADGPHSVRLTAIDIQDNTAAIVDVPFTLDTTPPTVVSAPVGSFATGLSSITVGYDEAVGGTALAATSYTIESTAGPMSGTMFQVTLVTALSPSSVRLQLVVPLPDGSYQLTVGAGVSDLAGNQTTAPAESFFSVDTPFRVVGHTPVANAAEVGVTFRPQVFFSEPVDPATLTSSNFFASFSGQTLAATIVPAQDGRFGWLFLNDPMPGASQIQVTVDGSTILAEGGQALDADGDGMPGGILSFRFSTVSVVAIPGTTVSGRVVDPGPDLLPMTADDFNAGVDGQPMTEDDVFLLPIAGVEVFLLGMEDHVVTTGADGRYQLTEVPSGNIKVAMDGTTATSPPPGQYFPEMVMDSQALPGVDNFVMGMETMYLPRLEQSILQTVNASDTTMVALRPEAALDLPPEDQPYLTVEVQPGSLVGADGQPIASGQIGISVVPPELVEGMLPPGVLEHTFDITVQAMGFTNFSQPAPMTFPNVFDAAPGEQLFFISFDHTTGRLVIEGTATVSPDGLFVSTDPGTGITHPGWHGLAPPGPNGGGDEPDDDDDDDDDDDCDDPDDACDDDDDEEDDDDPDDPDDDDDDEPDDEEDSDDDDIPDEIDPDDDNDGQPDGPSGAIAAGIRPGFESSFDIDVVFDDALLSTAHQQTVLDAAGRWEQVIVGDVPAAWIPGPNGQKITVDDIRVTIKVENIDGPGGNVLARGGPRYYRMSSMNPGVPPFPISGVITIDSGDIPADPGDQIFYETILHEFGHTLGFTSSMMALASLVDPGDANHFIGALSRSVYAQLRGTASEPFVPLEDGGGAGSQGAHWDEETFDAELMTGFSDPSEPMSELTVAYFHDFGYQVNLSAADAYMLPVSAPIVAGGSEVGRRDEDLGGFLEEIEILGFHGDFGTANSPVQPGYMPVTPSTTYTALQSFGWLPGSSTLGALDRGPQPGGNNLTRDLVQSNDATFAVDLHNGAWDVTVTMGDTDFAGNQMQVFAENVLRSNISTEAGEFISQTFRVFVLDGQLNLRMTGPSGVLLNALAVDFFELGVFDHGMPQPDSGRFAFATENVETSFVLRGMIDLAEGGALCPDGVVLSPNTIYRQHVLNLDSLEIGISSFATPGSGQNFGMPSILMGRFSGPDADSDGLFDEAEFILGTDANVADSDGDGINDLGEVQQGLNPLDDQPFATGVVATLPVSGEARELVIEGSVLNAQSQIAYVATGSYGLAIIDTLRFDQPILLSEIDLAGDAADVAVDSSLNMAAVASGAEGLHFVDVSDPGSPLLVRTIAAAATQVEIVDGIAYTTVGNEIRSYDLLTGSRLQTISLGGSAITGMAREGAAFYTIDAANVLRAIDLSSGAMILKGSLAMPNGGGKLFVGGGIAYVAAQGAFQGGFATADVSDPNSLVLLSGVDTINVAGRALAANGSGLLVAVGRPGGFGASFLDVMDVSDPSNTGAFLTRINLPQVPEGVAIGAGLALVADGPGGVHVVNYLAFDNLGQPPVVSAESALSDVDPGSPGIQIIEGTAVSVMPTVLDDVQLRNVELIVNGDVVRNDVSFPFDLSAFAPNIGLSAGSDQLSIQVRATDTGGNSSISTPILAQIVPDTFAPTIVGMNPLDGSKRSQALRTVTIDFSEPMETDTLTVANIQLMGPGGLVAPTDVQFRNNDRTVQLTYPMLAPGMHQVILNNAAITDRAGNSLGAGQTTSNFEIVLATAIWTNVIGGFWDEPSNWQDGILPGPTDDVLIDVPGDVVVTHRLGNTQVRNLATNNRFTLTGGTLSVSETVEVSSVFTLSGGTLSEAMVLNGFGGELLVPVFSFPVLNGVTLAMDLTVNNGSRVTLLNGLTLNGAAISLSSTGNFTSLDFSGSQTFGGTGEVVFDGTADSNNVRSVFGTLTIAAGVTVRTGVRGGSVGDGTNTVINQGLISAQTSTRTVTVSAGSFTNSGTLETLTGTTLSLANTWTNGGVISVNGGTLNLGGAFTTAGIGTISRNVVTPGTVNLSGTLTNTGTTYDLNTTTGTVNFTGTIVGGTVTSSGAAQLAISGFILPVLNGVTLAMDLTVNNGARVTSVNGLTLSSATISLASTVNFTSLDFSGSQTLGGTGQVVFDGTANSNNVRSVSGTLTIAAGVTIRTGVRGGSVGDSVNPVINQGLISAQTSGQTVTVSAGSFTNSGTLETLSGTTLSLAINWTNGGVISVNNGTLNLGGAFTTAGIGTINRNVVTPGTVNLSGTLTNTGTTYDLNTTTGTVNFTGTIVGGTLTSSGAAQLTIGEFFLPVLNGVTLAMDLTVNNGARVTSVNGLTLSSATISLVSTVNFTSLDFSGSQSLGGTGQVVFNGTADSNNVRSVSGTLTIAAGVTVRTGVRGGSVGDSVNPVINQGLISAQTSGRTVTVSAGSFTNSGTLEALSGTTLSLASNWTNGGVISVNGGTLNLGGSFTTAGIGTINRNVVTPGTVNLSGTLTNTGTTYDLNTTTGTVNFTGTIVGGTITSSGAAQLTIGEFFLPVLNGVTLAMDLTVNNGARVTSVNGLTLSSATISLVSTVNFTSLDFSGSQSLGGTGQVVFNGTADSNNVRSVSGTLTIATGVAIRTGVRGGSVGDGVNPVVNQGLISAQTSTRSITISAGSFTNSGILTAIDGGALVVFGLQSHAGTITAGPGGLITINGSFTQLAGGTVNLHVGGTATSQFGRINVTGAATLAGTLNIQLVNGFAPVLGNSFQVMTFASRSGTFGVTTGLDIGGGLFFDPVYGALDLTLFVI